MPLGKGWWRQQEALLQNQSAQVKPLLVVPAGSPWALSSHGYVQPRYVFIWPSLCVVPPNCFDDLSCHQALILEPWHRYITDHLGVLIWLLVILPPHASSSLSLPESSLIGDAWGGVQDLVEGKDSAYTNWIQPIIYRESPKHQGPIWKDKGWGMRKAMQHTTLFTIKQSFYSSLRNICVLEWRF